MRRVDVIAAFLAALASTAPHDPEREYLLQSGWVPLGREAGTGIEGWGKIIGDRAVVVSKAEAVRMQRDAEDV